MVGYKIIRNSRIIRKINELKKFCFFREFRSEKNLFWKIFSLMSCFSVDGDINVENIYEKFGLNSFMK